MDNNLHLFNANVLAITPELAKSYSKALNILLPQFAARAIPDGPSTKTGKKKAVAIIPLQGLITPRRNPLSVAMGWTTLDDFSAQVASAVQDDTVASILIDVDSGGGYTSGVQEASDLLYSLRGTKPIVAVSNYTCASAAYYLASSADKVFASGSSVTGSIGVYTVHLDLSKANEQAGLSVEYIYAGKYKTEGNMDSPLSQESREWIQEQVDREYTRFLEAVGRNRGWKMNLEKRTGEGRAFDAEQALELGLVDKIQTFEQTLGSLLGNKSKAQLRAIAKTQIAKAR